MRILKKYDVEDIIFFDIETAPGVAQFTSRSPGFDAWEYFCIGKEYEEDIFGSYRKMAALMPEFGRIVCITLGVVRGGTIFLKSFYGPNEKEILEGFNRAMDKTANLKTWLCGHSITGFDAPYIARKCMVNGLPMHNLIDVAHLKPWEVSYLDIASLWKGTAYKPASLPAMCHALGVPTPKDDISGSEVGKLYYQGEHKRIARYCEKDVIATIQCYQKMKGEEMLPVSEEGLTTEVGVLTYLVSGGEYTQEIRDQIFHVMANMTAEAERLRAYEILMAIPSKAKGQETHVTKKDLQTLRNEVEQYHIELIEQELEE